MINVSQTHYEFQLALAESNSLSVIQTFWAVLARQPGGLPEGTRRRVPLRLHQLRSAGRAGDQRAARARLQALVDSDQISAWFGYPIGIEPWVGGRFAMGGLDEPMRDQLGGRGHDRGARAGPQDGGRLRRRRRRRPGSWRTARARHGSPSSRVGSARQATVCRVSWHAQRIPVAAALPGGAGPAVHLRVDERGRVASRLPGAQAEPASTSLRRNVGRRPTPKS